MMKALAVLTLLQAPSPNSWFGADKAKHFLHLRRFSNDFGQILVRSLDLLHAVLVGIFHRRFFSGRDAFHFGINQYFDPRLLEITAEDLGDLTVPVEHFAAKK